MRLPAELARRARSHVRDSAAYQDLSELLSVALENQLELERETEDLETHVDTAEAEAVEASGSLELLHRPRVAPRVAEPTRSEEPLFSMTNRLFPLKIATRVLANVPPEVTLNEFRYAAAGVARTLGQKLRVEDSRLGLKGADRRWIALPVGDDEEAALARFAQHFTLGLNSGGEASGALAQLGLATLSDQTPCLTELGAELAMATSPVLDEGSGDTELLSAPEREVLIRALGGNGGELHAIVEFLAAVRAHAGRQEDVDLALRRARASWSDAQAVAHRAAIVGRLRDLGCASVEGRGPTARIRLADGVEEIWEIAEQR